MATSPSLRRLEGWRWKMVFDMSGRDLTLVGSLISALCCIVVAAVFSSTSLSEKSVVTDFPRVEAQTSVAHHALRTNPWRLIHRLDNRHL